MVRVAPVRLQYDPKVLWFDPGDLELHADELVIVTTARGSECGTMASDCIDAPKELIKGLRSPLRPVLRRATEEDERQRAEMRRLSEEAFPIFKELAAETNKDMHPVLVEYLFDGSKAIFLFEAEERNDFRELVRRLTARLRVRVDMRQIGVRDAARLIGGIGHCGQTLCCCRLGGGFSPVSIRMAKAQDLSLNPQQISGLCGRLMCCLRYEYDTYKDFKGRAPKMNGTIDTPEGPMKVCELDALHEEVVLKGEEDKRIRIPLSSFDAPPEGSTRPRSIGEAFHEFANDQGEAMAFMQLDQLESFTGEDKLAEKGAMRHNAPSKREGGEDATKEDKRPGAAYRRRRRRSQQGSSSGDQKAVDKAAKPSQGGKSEPKEGAKPSSSNRRRRRRSHGSDSAKAASARADASKSAAERSSGQAQPSAERPGSSKSRSKGASRSSQSSSQRPSSAEGRPAQDAKASSHRRSRRRSHTTGGDANDAQS